MCRKYLNCDNFLKNKGSECIKHLNVFYRSVEEVN